MPISLAMNSLHKERMTGEEALNFLLTHLVVERRLSVAEFLENNP